jgi:hypothetical protein
MVASTIIYLVPHFLQETYIAIVHIYGIVIHLFINQYIFLSNW